MQAVVELADILAIAAAQELQLLLVLAAMVAVVLVAKVAAAQFYILVLQTFEVVYKQPQANQIPVAVVAVVDHQCWPQTAVVAL
jgi:hypothetical protein